jgi:hypothetical protein
MCRVGHGECPLAGGRRARETARHGASAM